MPLTLEEVQSLVAALGVQVPPAILAEKARNEEFKARLKKSMGAAGAKPTGWHLKATFDDACKRAVAAAVQKQFEPAFKLLDEADQILQQPDAPPAPPPPPAPAPPELAPPVSTPRPEPVAAADGEDRAFQENWAAAKGVWLECIEKVNGQLGKVRAQMLASDDPDFKIIADRCLPALTDNHKTPVMKAIMDLERGAGPALKDAALQAGKAISSFRAHLNSFHLIRALDEHCGSAFGVELTLRRELGRGLSALEQAIQPLTSG